MPPLVPIAAAADARQLMRREDSGLGFLSQGSRSLKPSTLSNGVAHKTMSTVEPGLKRKSIINTRLGAPFYLTLISYPGLRVTPYRQYYPTQDSVYLSGLEPGLSLSSRAMMDDYLQKGSAWVGVGSVGYVITPAPQGRQRS